MSESENKVIAEQDGYKLSVCQRPPGGPQGLTVRVDGPNGHLEDHAILTFHKTFNGDEPLAETQVERNELKAELKSSKESVRELRKEAGKLRAEVKRLEGEVGKSAGEIWAQTIEMQISNLQKQLKTKSYSENS